MRLRSPRSIFLLGFLLILFARSSNGCSFSDGYIGTTIYDLVKDTDSIVLAEPVSEDRGDVVFNILEVLKGNFDAKNFRTRNGGNNCFPYSFLIKIDYPREILLKFTPPKIKLKYILFVDRTRHGWRISEEAASRTAIPITREDTPLLTIVKNFVRISSINNYEKEKQELKNLQKLAKANTKEYSRELVTEIQKFLDFWSPNKSFDDLRRLYSRSSKEDKAKVLWALAWGKHAEAADFINNTVLSKSIPNSYIGPISEFVTQTKNESLLVRLGMNFPKLSKYVRWPIMWALIRTADGKYPDIMLKALRSADNEEAGRLVEWFVRYPSDDAIEIVRSRVGKNYQENYEMSFGLAGMGDVETLNWAKEFMNSSSEDRWMAYYAIARSPLQEADNLAKRVIEAGGADDLVSLIQGYEESQNPNRWERLRDIGGRAKQDAKIDYWLKVTLDGMADVNDNHSPIVVTTLQ